MKYRIVYEVVEELSCRTKQGGLEAMSARSDDVDEYALCGEARTATLQEQQSNGSWKSIQTIKA